MLGSVKTVRLTEGYGFIRPDSNGTDKSRDAFFHKNDLLPALEFDVTLTERRVEFEPEDDDRGPRARNVRPASA